MAQRPDTICCLCIYNSSWTPNNVSVRIHMDWARQILTSRFVPIVLDTANINGKDFISKLIELQQYPMVIVYICLHGVIEDDTYYLKVNDRVKISNTDLSGLFISKTRYWLFMETCHSEKFFDTSVLNGEDNYNINILNTSETDQKTLVERYGGSYIGSITKIFYNYKLNPYISPYAADRIPSQFLKSRFSFEFYCKKKFK